MKKLFIFFAVIVGLSFTVNHQVQAQNITSYKVKTNANAKDRTQMLDILRAKLYENYKQEFVFVVNKLNVSSNGYAWFEGEAQRKDGKKVRVSQYADCCHVQALFKKSGGKWYIEESAAFATDVWYDGIWDRYPVSSALFFKD